MMDEHLREQIKVAIQTCPPDKKCPYDKMRVNQNVCVECITDSILSLIPQAEPSLKGIAFSQTCDIHDNCVAYRLHGETKQRHHKLKVVKPSPDLVEQVEKHITKWLLENCPCAREPMGTMVSELISLIRPSIEQETTGKIVTAMNEPSNPIHHQLMGFIEEHDKVIEQETRKQVRKDVAGRVDKHFSEYKWMGIEDWKHLSKEVGE